MDCSVDENLRALSYSVAKGRVLGKIMEMGATIVDDPKVTKVSGGRKANSSTSMAEVGGRRFSLSWRWVDLYPLENAGTEKPAIGRE